MSEPLIVYHGTLDQIEEGFRPLSHFGTVAAARTRIEQKEKEGGSGPGYLYEVELAFEQQLRIRDWRSNRSYEALCDDLLRNADCPQWRRSRALIGGNPVERTVDYLLSEGFDVASYINEVEDPGSVSYINLTMGEVTVQSRTTVQGDKR